jgi:hypothetical protein
MAQIVGSMPNRRPTRPPRLWRAGNGPLRRRLSPCRSVAPRGRPTRCDQRSCQGGYFYVPVRRGVCPLQDQGTSGGPALPTWAWAGPGMTGLLGNRPQSNAAPRGPGSRLGAAACTAGNKRNAPPVLQVTRTLRELRRYPAGDPSLAEGQRLCRRCARAIRAGRTDPDQPGRQVHPSLLSP